LSFNREKVIANINKLLDLPFMRIPIGSPFIKFRVLKQDCLKPRSPEVDVEFYILQDLEIELSTASKSLTNSAYLKAKVFDPVTGETNLFLFSAPRLGAEPIFNYYYPIPKSKYQILVEEHIAETENNHYSMKEETIAEIWECDKIIESYSHEVLAEADFFAGRYCLENFFVDKSGALFFCRGKKEPVKIGSITKLDENKRPLTLEETELNFINYKYLALKKKQEKDWL